jgi:RNA polymerase sigma-70 factor (ECF subfamily)
METAEGRHPDERETRLTSLYDQNSAAVYGFLVARCGNPDVAGDVMSEVFVAAARASAGERPEQITRSWLLTTARRRLIDHWRRQSTRDRTLAVFGREREPESGGDSPLDRQRVTAALASLPTNQRLALTLRYLDDHSVAEAADALAVTYQAAESLLARARRSFKRAWETQ